MAQMYMDEFLYRGKMDGKSSAWHVVLAMADKHPITGADIVHLSNPMTPEQAKEKGFDLPAVIADINAQTLADLAEARQALEDQKAAWDSAMEQARGGDEHTRQEHIVELAARDDKIRGLMHINDQLHSEMTEHQKRLDAMEQHVELLRKDAEARAQELAFAQAQHSDLSQRHETLKNRMVQIAAAATEDV